MKEILIKIDDKLFENWHQEVGIKMMCGNFDKQSLSDGVAALIIKAIDDEKKEVTIFQKK